MEKFKRGKLTAEIISISRDEARVLWEEIGGAVKNIKANSDKGNRAVKRFRADMVGGKWGVFNPPDKREALPSLFAFNDRGKLWEGKHRLKALAFARENITIEFLAIMGLKEEDKEFIAQRFPGYKNG